MNPSKLSVFTSIDSIKEMGNNMREVTGKTAAGVALVLTLSATDLEAQSVPCDVTGFPTQIEQPTSGFNDRQFTNNQGGIVRVRELTAGRDINDSAPGVDQDADHTGGVQSERFYASGGSGRGVVSPTTPLGEYQFERQEFPSGCLDTVTVEVVPNGALPLELMDQSAEWDGEDMVIGYTTARRINTDRTYAEVAIDGHDFTKADSVVYDPPNMSEVEDHEMVIEAEVLEDMFGKLQPGQVMYIRLRNKDLDGSEQYPGSIMALRVDENGRKFSTLLYPNPASVGQNITLEADIQDGPVYISIFDAQGQKVADEVSAGGGRISLDNGLNPGLYFVKVYNDKGTMNTLQLFVQ